jgi:hypothetical protein
MKRPARVNIGIDKDSGAVDRFNCAAAIPGAVVKVGCGLEFLRFYEWQGSEFVYLDPSYLPEACKSGLRYKYALTGKDHKRLLAIIRL